MYITSEAMSRLEYVSVFLLFVKINLLPQK